MEKQLHNLMVETNLIAVVVIVEMVDHVQITPDVADGRVPLALVQLLRVQHQMRLV